MTTDLTIKKHLGGATGPHKGGGRDRLIDLTLAVQGGGVLGCRGMGVGQGQAPTLTTYCH